MDPLFPFYMIDIAFQNYAFHWHELVEIILILNGKIVVSINGNIIEATKGDIVVITPNSIHGFYNAIPGTTVSIFQVGLEIFDQALIDLQYRELQILVFSSKIHIRKKEDASLHKRLERILLESRREYMHQDEGYRLAIKLKLFEFALIFLREIPIDTSSPIKIEKRNYNREILERLFSFIHDNADDPELSLEQAADVAAFSKFYFTRFFREQTGQTFHTYLSRVRVSHVEEYLLNSDISITEIAYKCGFSSLKTFNRLFKTYTGTSPSSYRTIKR
jgi:AraC-like DNA-binding protein